jgi:hypothetical protein
LLIVTENGFGKRTELSEYRVQNRAGKGILTYRVTEKTGPISGMKLVCETDDIILISSDGTIIRMPASTISVIGRATQGVTLMRTSGGNKVVGLTRTVKEPDDEPENGDAADEDMGNGLDGSSAFNDIVNEPEGLLEEDSIGYGLDVALDNEDIENVPESASIDEDSD